MKTCTSVEFWAINLNLWVATILDKDFNVTDDEKDRIRRASHALTEALRVEIAESKCENFKPA